MSRACHCGKSTRSQCKTCARAYCKQWHERNKRQESEKARARYVANPEPKRAYARLYQAQQRAREQKEAQGPFPFWEAWLWP
jgi:hypothetical protein